LHYLTKIGAVDKDNKSFYLLYVPYLVQMVTYGRMMQSSSDDVWLSLAMELMAVVAEIVGSLSLMREHASRRNN